ncbi:MAG: Ig-like domain-containing protein [Syntrophothermus sp.]
MKNRFLLLCVVLFSSALFAQNMTGIKVCVNPGHGGHDPANDRFIPATGFWESDGNVDKGLYLRDILKAWGCEVIMTRTTNNDADDLPLSQIVSIANSNNVHHMHSIHSNAHNSQVNYTLLLFQGGNNSPTYPNSKVMGQYVLNEIYASNRTTNTMLSGDFDFYGTGAPYLGVFKGLTMPGTLSEGSFHDYIPESWRLMNTSYRKHEAWAIARAFVTFWGKTPNGTGTIAGLVRDPVQGVSYFGLSSKSDHLKPLNNVLVTLQPGNKTYKGDQFNNGFFFFDSLAPGQYKVIVSAADYYTDSVDVSVTASKTTFADRNLRYDTTSAPSAINYIPASATDSVKATAQVKITFNKKMSRTACESAFSITPSVAGTLSWENEDRVLVFTPTGGYDKATKYTVTLSASAKSYWGTSVTAPVTFSFVSLYRNRLIFEKSYPASGQTDIPVKVLKVRLQYDAQLNAQTTIANVKIFETKRPGIEFYPSFSTVVENGKGVIYAEILDPLLSNTQYSVEMNTGLVDVNGSGLGEKKTILFTTTNEIYFNGNIIENFETKGIWQHPVMGPESRYIDTLYTTGSSFNYTSARKLNGDLGGRLAYSFLQDSLGVCQSISTQPASIGSSSDGEFGMWVLGDLSGNILEYKFSNKSGSNITVAADSLNWSGWKLKRIPVSKIMISGEKYFSAINIRQVKGGFKKSIIYVDDAQNDIVMPVERTGNGLPENYSLMQNFPNPFNPSTFISYSLPENALVTLKVFDLLGREVATLVNGQQKAGIYRVNMNAGNLTSGVYIYKISAGRYSESKKMMLVK